jgi:hypothetical protein
MSSVNSRSFSEECKSSIDKEIELAISSMKQKIMKRLSKHKTFSKAINEEDITKVNYIYWL